MADENDISLPKATIVKLIKEFSAPDMRMGSDTVDMLMDCCTEFVQLLASESNEVSTKDKKNTITPEHVITALEQLGFAEFVDDVKEALQQFKEESKMPRLANRKSKADTEGMTEEEQIAMQKQLFAAARMRSQSMDMAAQAAVAAAYSNLGQLQQQQTAEATVAHQEGSAEDAEFDGDNPDD